MTDRLSLYNDALMLCGERFLASLTEEREPRRLLDQVWGSGAVNSCLEEAQWFFAMRTIQIDYDPGIQPSFGYNRGFVKPVDWLETSSVCSDEFFRNPLTRYTDESGYWYAELDTIYVRYISNDLAYGNNLSLWPDSFRLFVVAYLASEIIVKITNSEDKYAQMVALKDKRLKHAKNRAAMALPTSFPAQGSWTRSRMRYGGNRDGGNSGNSGNLIG